MDLHDPPLRVGVSSRALFDLADEHRVFDEDGPAAYMDLQRRRRDEPLAPGPGFAVVERLLASDNGDGGAPLAEVVLISRSPPPLAARIFSAIAAHGLAIRTGSFACGSDMAPFASAWNVDLFLSADRDDVTAALRSGIAAARLGEIPRIRIDDRRAEVRIALDADAVVFDGESDAIFQREGLDAFLRHENERRHVPMGSGPFGQVFRKLARLRHARTVRIALVTARGAPAHARILRTLEAWGTAIDELHFTGDGEKGAILQAFGAHIFFDDNPRHVANAAPLVPTGLVPAFQEQ